MSGQKDNIEKRYVLKLPVITSGLRQYFSATLIVIIISAACFYLTDFIGYRSVSFILLFVVSILSIFMGIGPITLASTLSAFIWDFFFIPPQFTIHIGNAEDALMFVMFFIIALVNGILTSRIRRQEKLAIEREEKTNALYQFTKEVSRAANMDELMETAVSAILKYFKIEPLFILQDGNGKPSLQFKKPGQHIFTAEEIKAAEWSFHNSIKTGKYCEEYSHLEYTFYPLTGNRIKPGLMAVKHSDLLQKENLEFLETFISQISNAVEIEFLDEIASRTRLLDESDKLYKTLFNSISHELRIPVSTIMGASDSLLTSNHDAPVRSELYNEIFKASNRLNRLIENLLNMSRLEVGRITPKLDWFDIHDLINKVCGDLRDDLKSFTTSVEIAENVPFIKIDFGLMEQVLYNLIYNSTQYSRQGSEITIKAFFDKGIFLLEVMDNGPGIPENELSLIFNKFYRIGGSKPGGTGLGLSIAKGFVEAHKGTITAENLKEGGAKFSVKIPTSVPDEIPEKELKQ